MTDEYTEVFKPEFGSAPKVAVFYTIATEDVGRTLIRTTAGIIPVSSFMGRVQDQDIGKRIYRDYDALWRVENDKQRAERLAGRGGSCGERGSHDWPPPDLQAKGTTDTCERCRATRQKDRRDRITYSFNHEKAQS
jgi:hypothetical protein